MQQEIEIYEITHHAEVKCSMVNDSDILHRDVKEICCSPFDSFIVYAEMVSNLEMLDERPDNDQRHRYRTKRLGSVRH